MVNPKIIDQDGHPLHREALEPWRWRAMHELLARGFIRCAYNDRYGIVRCQIDDRRHIDVAIDLLQISYRRTMQIVDEIRRKELGRKE